MGAGFVGIVTVHLHRPEGASQRAERRGVVRVKSRLVRDVGGRVAQVHHHDLWRRPRLARAVVARHASQAARRVQRAARMLTTDPVFQVVSTNRQIIDVATGAAGSEYR